MRLASRSGADKAKAARTNIMIRRNGDAELSSYNEAENPDLKEFTLGGFPVGWPVMGHVPAYTGWNRYSAGPVRQSWQPNKAYAVNDWTVPRSPNGHVYRITTGGNSGPTEPSPWPTENGQTITVNGVVYQEAGPDTHFPRVTRQNHSPLPYSQAFDKQFQALIDGAEPPDVVGAYPLPVPPAPAVEIISTSYVGFRDGWYPVALAWIIGEPHVPRRRRITRWGPTKVLYLAQGQVPDVRLYDTAPKGVPGVAIGMGSRSATEAEASAKVAHLQDVVEIRGGVVPDRHTVYGPWQNGGIISGANDTYIGGRFEWPKPRVDFIRRNREMMQSFTTRFSYRIRTRFGWSKLQTATDRRTYYKGGGAAVRLRPPTGLPWDVLEWDPHFVGRDGTWYSGGPRKLDRPFYIQTLNLEKWPDPPAPTQAEVEDLQDETGMPSPEEEIPEVIATGVSQPQPGTYDELVTLQAGDDEGPPSARRRFTIGSGQTWRTYKPLIDNSLAGAYFEERDPTTDGPAEWETANGATASAPEGFGRQSWTDQTAALTDADIVRSKRYPMASTDTAAFRFYSEVHGYTSGRVRAVLRQTDTSGVISDTNLGEQTANGTVIYEPSLGPVGSGAQFTTIANLKDARIVVYAVGSTGNGSRRFSVKLSRVGIWPGLVAPRIRVAEKETWVPNAEPVDTAYPTGGYIVVVETPDWSPGDLASFDLNGFEYFGPAGTPASDRYGPEGLQTPVKEGELWCFSMWIESKGVVNPSAVRVVWRDEFGNAISEPSELPAVHDNIVGNIAATRFHTSGTAPEGAAYAEVLTRFGDGLIRLIGFQNERGVSVPSAFTNANATSGELISTFLTALPDVPAAAGRAAALPHDGVKRVMGGGVLHTDQPADGTPVTSVATDFRSRALGEASYGAWVTDPTALTKFDDIQVRAVPSTTDATKSPVIHELFVEVERFEPVLLRSDGSEFPGGVSVYDASPSGRVVPWQRRIFADGSRGKRKLGESHFQMVVNLEAFLENGAQAVADWVEFGDGIFLYEDPDLRRRYVLEILNVSFGPVERARKIPVPGAAGNNVWIYVADGIECDVLQEVFT